jgi:hypothetical protein
LGPIDATIRERLLASARTTTQSPEIELTHRAGRRDFDAPVAARVVDACAPRGIDAVGAARGIDAVGAARDVDACAARGIDAIGAARGVDAVGAASTVGDLTGGLADTGERTVSTRVGRGAITATSLTV